MWIPLRSRIKVLEASRVTFKGDFRTEPHPVHNLSAEKTDTQPLIQLHFQGGSGSQILGTVDYTPSDTGQGLNGIAIFSGNGLVFLGFKKPSVNLCDTFSTITVFRSALFLSR